MGEEEKSSVHKSLQPLGPRVESDLDNSLSSSPATKNYLVVISDLASHNATSKTHPDLVQLPFPLD